jgi:hypothetical protein
MIQTFSIEQLIIPSISIFIIGTLILYIYTKNIILSSLITFLKASIFFIYFSFFFDGTFTFLDDFTYLAHAEKYIDNQYDTLYLLLHPWEFIPIFSNRHFLYQLWNVLAFNIYETSYFAPVSLNIIVTFLTSLVLFKLLYTIGMVKKYAIWFALFYVIYWNTLSWSSLLNLKDFLVQLFSILLIYNIVSFEKYKKNIYVFYIILIVLLLESIRFYLPFLVGTAYFIFKLFEYRNKFNESFRISINIFFVILFAGFIIILIPYFQDEIQLLLQDFVNPIYGVVRFLFTPTPFYIEKAYQFLIFSAFLTWFGIPFLFYGVYLVYKQQNRYCTFILMYIFVILLFYGTYGELQGPRHRIQLDPYLSFFQLIGFLSMFYGNKKIMRIFNAKNSISN